MKRMFFLSIPMTSFLFMSILLLSSCASTPDTHKGKADADYMQAKHMVDNNDFGRANLFLEKFSSQHPYSKHVINAEILRIYASYKGKEYILAETLSQQFIDRHPRHSDIAYAHYILGMAHYKQISPPEKDQEQTRLAIIAFKTLQREYPNSAYAKEVANQMQYLYNHLAKHELDVGKFYFQRERYIAAANRFQIILNDYQTTPSIEEALYYLSSSFAKLGVSDSAFATARLLEHNYPSSQWTKELKPLLQQAAQ
ncbi:MAG: outer membrane protein assembly factor BamD [Mariprofundales bacterium]